MSAEFDRLVAEFEKFQAKMKHVDRQMAGVADMQNELAQLEATAANSDRSVTVVAGPGGAVKDIQLTDKAMTQPPQALAATIKTTLQEAVAEAARKQAGIVDNHMGGLGINVTEQVIETQAEMLGVGKEELRRRMADERPRSASPEEEYHEDYSHQSLFDGDDSADDKTAPPAAGSSGASSGDEFLKNLFNEDDR